jgi:hypothetical protein
MDEFCFICDAGYAMSNLAVTYRDIGRHADALAMGERALEFRRRVLSENHPDTGEDCVCQTWGGRHCMWCIHCDERSLVLFDVQARSCASLL